MPGEKETPPAKSDHVMVALIGLVSAMGGHWRRGFIAGGGRRHSLTQVMRKRGGRGRELGSERERDREREGGGEREGEREREGEIDR